MSALDTIPRQLSAVRGRIAEAALRAGRAPDAVRLIAVSKTFPAEAVLAAWEAGQREFGENRPEEGAQKIPQVQAALSRERQQQPILWHMIGQVQRRKAALVVEHFEWVHSVERQAVAERLSAVAQAVGREITVLLECNVSGEASKSGYPAADWQTDAAARAALFAAIGATLTLPGLRVAGLMTLAPRVDEAEQARPVFASLRALRDALREQFPQHEWRELSMGMSDDFEVAIAEGGTLVRIGRAIFGARETAH